MSKMGNIVLVSPDCGKRELTKTATGPKGWVGFEEVRRLDLVNLSPSLITGGIYYFEIWGWLSTPLYFRG